MILEYLKKHALNIALFQAVVASLGSLYASEVLHFIPCVLCWYQRVLMFPLVIILYVGIVKKDKNLPYYALPFSILGILVALYQYLLQAGVISETFLPCVSGVSCTTKYFEWFGFVTIPFLSTLAFSLVTYCLIVFKNGNQNTKTSGKN